MYQGYMKRGISLLIYFFAIIGISVALRFEILMLVLPVIWAYSFFDTFNLRSLTEEQHAAMGDFFIPMGSTSWAMGKWPKNLPQAKVAGWACIALGAIALYSMCMDTIYAIVWYFSPTIAGWVDNLPSLLIALAIILLGLYLLRGGKRAHKKQEIEQHYEENNV